MTWAARGYEVTTGFVERARNFRPGFVKGSVRVIVRAAASSLRRVTVGKPIDLSIVLVNRTPSAKLPSGGQFG